MHMHKDTTGKQNDFVASDSERTMSTAMHMYKDTTGRTAHQLKRHTEPTTWTLPAITPELIRRRAHEIFLARNGHGGDAVSDWLQAERELSDAMMDSALAVCLD